jgi:hypothetical protein
MREVLRASEGFILTNGKNYGRVIYLAEGMSADGYYEIPMAEYEAMWSSEKATEDDYQAALGEMGVKL